MLHFSARHAIIFCTAAAVLLGGTAFSIASYHKTKAELQVSEAQLLEAERENRKLEQRAETLQGDASEYEESIEAIQALEQKVNELEGQKSNLVDEINNLNELDPDTDLTSMATALTSSADAAPNFTSIISTPYHKTESLSASLDKMHTMIDASGTSLTALANEVTYLASQNNIPGGWPVESRLVSTEFNPTGSRSVGDGRKHCGMDISTNSQIIPIYATAAGKVVTANYHSDYGYQVILDHYNGFTTLYAHCDELMVKEGDIVQKGDQIATTGDTGYSTGIHLHYEIMLNGMYQNPRDYL
ncbi:MAG: peptidoglycan DD-metalloendopeptidase family protein [Bacillota bacterium]|nr:peptidoglycan DD-metalloendopeptidase family protein [Bacillota bacterium]